jgi:hypothetical protein
MTKEKESGTLTDYEEIYDDFWKAIVEDENGVLNLDQVKRELADFRMVMEEVRSVYSWITDGRMSKCTYMARDVIREAEEVAEQHIQEAIEDFLHDYDIPDPRMDLPLEGSSVEEDYQ